MNELKLHRSLSFRILRGGIRKSFLNFMAFPVGLSQLIIDELKLEKNICKNKRTRAPPHLDLGYLCTENLNQLTFAYFALPATTKLFLT